MNPLAEMKDIHLGTAIHQWPVAIGWWLVAILILLIVIVLINLVRQTLARRAVIRSLTERVLAIDTTANWLSEINILLKRVAISYFPETQVQQMNNPQWLSWLTAQVAKSEAEAFNREYGELLEMSYRPISQQTCDPERVKALTNQWIRRTFGKLKRRQLMKHLKTVQGSYNV